MRRYIVRLMASFMIFLAGCVSSNHTSLTIVENNKIAFGCVGADLPQGRYVYRVELYHDNEIIFISSDESHDQSYNIPNAFKSALSAVEENISDAPFQYLEQAGSDGGHRYVEFTVGRDDTTLENVSFRTINFPNMDTELALSNWVNKVFLDFSQRLPKVGEELYKKCYG